MASVGAIALATLLPASSFSHGSHFCLICGSLGGLNAVLNVFLFVPFGVGLALSGFSGKRVVFVACVLSAFIEIAQLSIPGRDSTLGDVVANTIGGGLGFMMGHYAELWLRPTPRTAVRLALGWAAVWLVVQIVSSFGYSLSLSNLRYYGQIRPTFENFAIFPGQVLTASIGEIPIPNTRIGNSYAVRRSILNGAALATTVVPGDTTRAVAPIVRVVDEKKQEVVMLAQIGDGMIFGARTGAAVLLLRLPLFGVHNVFATSRSRLAMVPVTLTLSGRYEGSEVKMKVQSNSAIKERSFPLDASLGWTLWLPFQWIFEGTGSEIVLSWVWLACLVIPVGYWSIRIRDFPQSRAIFTRLPTLILAGLAIMSLGLVLVPVAFGLAAARISDWLASLAGLLIGRALAAGAAKLSATPRVPGGSR